MKRKNHNSKRDEQEKEAPAVAAKADNMRDMLILLRSGKIPSERSREYWSEKEKKELIERFLKGEGVSSIAISLQRSENTIFQQLVALDLFARCNKPRNHENRGKKCPKNDENCEYYKGGFCFA